MVNNKDRCFRRTVVFNTRLTTAVHAFPLFSADRTPTQYDYVVRLSIRPSVCTMCIVALSVDVHG